MGELDVAATIAEFSNIALGDARLSDRLQRIVERIASCPQKSFPDQMETEADQEALYRFLANDKISLEKILSGHQRETCKRIGERKVVRILHDTSEFVFAGEREGLEILKGKTKGFFAHVALAVSGDEAREPLGVLGVHPFVNENVLANRGLTRAERCRAMRQKKREDKKSSRWESLALKTAAVLPNGTRGIHVMDQEANDYAVFERLLNEKVDFVIRGSSDRMLVDKRRVKDALSQQPAHGFREVTVSARARKTTAFHRLPQRAARNATLKLSWSALSLARPENTLLVTPHVDLNVVQVFEPEPPPGEEPIVWTLFTSERVESLEDAVAVVDHYRARWVIEEFFKALKTGCAFEKRQLCSLEGLTRAFGLFIPMAWKLLSIRQLGRAETARPAVDVLDDEQQLLLRALLARRNRTLPAQPSTRDVMLAIAGLGGHIKNNGDPGWQVLGRGLERFLDAEVGWQAARRCDQS
jgi:hypothetical protein